MDADGQPTPGMLEGNLQSVGNYDECLEATATGAELSAGVTHDFSAKYCKVSMWYDEMGVPYIYSSVGVCVPEYCTRDDVMHMLAVGDNSRPVFKTYCGERTPFGDNAGAIIVTVILCIFVAIVIGATCVDHYLQWSEQHSRVELTNLSGPSYQTFDQKPTETSNIERGIPLCPNDTTGKEMMEVTGANTKVEDNGKPLRALLAFSLLRNIPRLLSTYMPPGTYTALNGIRCLSMAGIILGHTWNLSTRAHMLYEEPEPNPIFIYVVDNEFSQRGLRNRWTHQIINNIGLMVDTFLLLSSCLVTVSFLKQLDHQDGRPTTRQMVLYYVHRYVRLTPLYAALIMIGTTMHYWGSGPLFPESIVNFDVCKQTWWANLLYINNLYEPRSMCQVWTWYLAVDFQFYAIAPLFIFILYKFTIPGAIFLFLGFSGSLAARAVLFTNADDPDLLASNLFDIYIKPWCRFGPYAIGIGLGYIMYRTDCKVRLSRIAVAIVWLVAVSLCLLVLYGSYKIEQCKACAIVFNATHRDVFSLGTALILFACCTGYGGIVDRFLSLSAFVPLAKLTYAMYLVHPMIMLYNLFQQRKTVYINDVNVSIFFCAYLLLTTFGAFVASLFFEVPMMELDKNFITGRKRK